MTSLLLSLLSSKGTIRTPNQNPDPPDDPPDPTDPTLDLLFEGGGALATGGGSGGTVYEVTNLNDSGTGSFRDALSSGNRHVVFRVAGTIHLASSITVTASNISIWGETAPGEVLVTGRDIPNGGNLIGFRGRNYIIRYLSLLRGRVANDSGGGGGDVISIQPFAGGTSENIMIDHCTLAWCADECVSIWTTSETATVRNISVQNCIIAAVNRTAGSFDHHVAFIVGASYRAAAERQVGISAHRNLCANNTHRIGNFGSQEGEWINNIVYNWIYRITQLNGGNDVDIIGNLYKIGPDSSDLSAVAYRPTDSRYPNDPPSIYIEGNQAPGDSGVTPDQWAEVELYSGVWVPQGTGLSSGYRRFTRLSSSNPVTVLDVSELDSSLLPHIGNSRHRDENGNWVSRRPDKDAEWIANYENGTSGYESHYPTTAASVGWPTPKTAGYSAYTSTGGDGLPDTWKAANPGKTLEEFCLGYTRS